MKRRGYTLMEILMVISVIAVLSAIVFGVMGAVKNRAKHAVCAEQLHSLGAAITLYANDHDGWVPPATTDEWFYAHRDPPLVSLDELKASPQLFHDALRQYVKNEAIWFCPTDAYAHKDILWLGQRHLITSYRYFPRMEGRAIVWPPLMQLNRDRLSNIPEGAEDVPLIGDAVGVPSLDSDPEFENDHAARSNHPDGMVNSLRHDLSLSRRPANYWMGTH